MAKPAAGAVPLDKLELYEKLVATNPNVERKGATVPYTSVNGNMFSYLSKEGKLELRLPAGEREMFLKKYKARLCEAYGKVQPEYVEVPDSLLASTNCFAIPATVRNADNLQRLGFRAKHNQIRVDGKEPYWDICKVVPPVACVGKRPAR